MRRLWASLAMVIALGGGAYVIVQQQGGGGTILGGTVDCKVSNRTTWDTIAEGLGGTQCQYKGLVTRTNTAFNCTAALSTYGTLPLKVVLNYSASVDDNAFTLDNGCTGDGCSGGALDTIDVIVDVRANGVTSGIGPTDDSAKTRQSPGPSCIQVTGTFEGGAPGGGSHPDCWQLQGGTSIDLVNAKSGNWAAGTSTAQGAGGCVFWTNPTDFDVYGGEFVACNHGLNGNAALLGDGNTIQDAKFRTGRTESVGTGGDPNCDGYSPSPPCINTTDMTLVNVVCQAWNATTNTWEDNGSVLTANLWMDSNGGTCTRTSGAGAAYSDAAACSQINTALTAASTGDIVRVKAGTYNPLIISGFSTKTVEFAGTPGVANDVKFGQLITNASNLTFRDVTFENRFVTWDGSTCAYRDYVLFLCGSDITLDNVVIDGLNKGYADGDSNRLGGLQVSGNRFHISKLEIKNIRDNKGYQGGGDDMYVEDSLFHDVALTTAGAAADVHLECAAVTEGNNQRWSRNKFYRCGQINWVAQNYVNGPVFGPVTLENNVFAHPILNDTAFAWQSGAPCLSLTAGQNDRNAWNGWIVRHNTFECGISVVQTVTTADDNGSALWYGNLGEDPSCSYPEWTSSYNVGSVCNSKTGNDVVANALNTSAAQNQSPFYVDAPGNDFHLNSTSAAIDQGNTAAYPATDIDNQNRYLGSAPDVGADERS